MTMPSIRQRFAKNISKQPDLTGYGKSAFISKGYNFPTHSQMNQFSRYGIIYDIDPGIRDLVIDINRAGYRTAGSCQGHIKGHSGFITILLNKEEIPRKLYVDHPDIIRHLNKEQYSRKAIDIQEIKGILKKHGLIFIRYDPPRFSKGNQGSYRLHHAILFRPVIDRVERR